MKTNCTRPLRVPEEIEICAAEPAVAKADEMGSWTLTFALAEDVSPEHDLWLHVHGGRNLAARWPGFQTADPSAEGYLSLKTRSGVPLVPKGATDDAGVFSFAVPPSGLRRGDRLAADLGGAVGIRAPKLAVPDRFFLLHAVPANVELRHPLLYGDRPERLVGICTMDIVGGDPVSIRALAPSVVTAGREFSILVRPEDLNRNVACAEPGSLTVRLNGRDIPARRVPVEGSACCRLEGIALSAEGVYRLEVRDSNGPKALTNPIRVAGETAPRVLWGSVHGHTQVSDGTGSLDRYFAQMRDECAVDFGSTADHDHGEQITDDIWAQSQEGVARHNTPGEFTAFLGYEWAKWRKRGDGDRNVYYLRDRRPMYRSDDDAYPAPPDLFRALREEEALVIPHHPAHIGNHNDWKDHDPSKERLVEIYSYWGCSERSIEDGNTFPGSPQHESNPNSGINPLGCVQRALAMGWRLGFVAASDDHHGHVSDWTIRTKVTGIYTGGMTAARARENTREAIWEALWNRRCYGTTGARIVADFSVSGHPMGSEISLLKHPDLTNERVIRISVHAAGDIRTVEIVRNNADVYAVTPDGPDAEIEWVDAEPLSAVNLPPAMHSAVPFTFYYVRVTQEDGQIAWLSPVWIVP